MDPTADWEDLEAAPSASAILSNSDWIYNPTPLARFLHKCRVQRGAIISIENSNGFQNSGAPAAVGRIGAQRKKFAAAGLKAWGIHLQTMHGTDGTGGWVVTTGFAPTYDDFYRDTPNTTGSHWLVPASIGNAKDLAISAVHDWGRSGDTALLTPWNSVHTGLYSIATVNAGSSGGVIITQHDTVTIPNLIDYAANLKCDIWYADKSPAGGTLSAAVHRRAATGTALATSGTLTVAAGTPTFADLVRYQMDVPAASRGADTYLTVRPAGGGNCTGSKYVSYIMVSQHDRDYGLAYGTYWGIGGTSVADFVWATDEGSPDESFTISAISTAAAPAVTVSAAHGWTDQTGQDTELVLITNSNSTPTINGVWSIEVTSTTAFTIATAPGFGPSAVPTTTVAGTSGTVTRFLRPINTQTLVHHNHALMYPIVDKNQDPLVCFRICDVLNMRNEVSLGIQYRDTADSVAAYKTALRSAIATCLKGWMATRFTNAATELVYTKAENACVWVDPDHPPSASDSEIAAYIVAAKEVADEFPGLVTVTDTSAMVTYQQLLDGTAEVGTGASALSYYQSSGTDTNHLTKAGYEYVEGIKVALVMSLPNPDESYEYPMYPWMQVTSTGATKEIWAQS